MTNERCPICGASAEVNQTPVGYVAHCSQCYDGDPGGSDWEHLQGHDADPEVAVERWLEEAREHCAINLPPPLRIPYTLTAKAAS